MQKIIKYKTELWLCCLVICLVLTIYSPTQFWLYMLVMLHVSYTHMVKSQSIAFNLVVISPDL